MNTGYRPVAYYKNQTTNDFQRVSTQHAESSGDSITDVSLNPKNSCTQAVLTETAGIVMLFDVLACTPLFRPGNERLRFASVPRWGRMNFYPNKQLSNPEKSFVVL